MRFLSLLKLTNSKALLAQKSQSLDLDRREEASDKFSRLAVVWVDQGYSGKKFAHAVKQVCGEHVQVEVIKRTSKSFEVLPKRWIVERTFGWLNRYRRLS